MGWVCGSDALCGAQKLLSGSGAKVPELLESDLRVSGPAEELETLSSCTTVREQHGRGSVGALLELLVLLQSSDWFLQEKVLLWTPVITLL